jgi:trigger factor
MSEIVVRKTREDPGAAELAVTVPPDHVRAAEDRAARVYQGRAKLPGFRKGKAPAGLVRKHYAGDNREQALQDVVREGWKVALEQERLQPIADPHISNLRWDDGATVTFDVHVEVRPEIALPRLGGFQLTRRVAAVTEAQVDTQLDELRAQRAPWAPVEGERP